MKKAITIFFLVIISASFVSAAFRDTLNDNLETIKQKNIDLIGQKIERVLAWKEQKLDPAPINDEARELINGFIEGWIAGLEQRKEDIAATTTIEEYIRVRKEINQYIINNIPELQKAVFELRKALNEEISNKITEIVDKINARIDELQPMCPGQQAEIEALQDDLDGIDEEVNELRQLILNNSSAALITIQTNKVYAMISNVIISLESIINSCSY